MSRVRTLHALLLGIALAVGATGSPVLAQESSDRGYQTANGLLNRGLYELAIPEYEQFLQDHPEHQSAETARYGLAVCHFRTGDWQETLDALEPLQGRRGFRFGAEVALLRGHSHMTLGDYPNAVLSLKIILDRHPDHDAADDAAALLTEANYRMGAHDRALVSAGLVQENWPDSPMRSRTDLFAGLSQLALKRSAEAATTFEGLLRRDSDGDLADQARLLLAKSLHRAGRRDDAARQYAQVIRNAPDALVAEAMLGSAQLAHERNDLETAGRTLDELLERFPRHSVAGDALLERGRVWFDAEDFGRARRLFDRANRRGNEALEDDIAYWLAKCTLREGNAGAAAEEFERALEKHPSSELAAEMLYDRGVALSRVGDGASAIPVLEEFRSRYPKHGLAPDALYAMARIAHGREQFDESRSLCRRFRRDYPEHRLLAAVEFLTAENEYLAGRYPQAEQAYRALLAGNQSDEQRTKAQFRLGMALYRQDRPDDVPALLTPIVNGAQTSETYRPALLALGEIAFRAERWTEAETFLTDYLSGSVTSSTPDALIKLGLAQQRRGAHEKALATYGRLIARHADSSHALQAAFEQGQALLALERQAEAIAAFEQVLERGPDSRFAPYAMNHLGVLAQQKGDFEQAADWFARAGATGNEQVAGDALFESGRSLLAARQYPQAIATFSEIVNTEHPRRNEARAHRAIAMARADQHEEAVTELTTALRRDLPDALRDSGQYERAWCLRQLNRTDEAAQAYKDVVTGTTDVQLKAYALLDLASIDMEGERYAKAAPRLVEVRDLARANEVVGDDVSEQAAYRLGVCALRTDDHAAVVEVLDEFHSTWPESDLIASASLICAESLLARGEHRRAIGHLERVTQRYPADESAVSALLRLGDAHAALQSFSRSEEAFRTFLREHSESNLWFQAQFGLGFARENQQRFDEAIQDYRKVIDGHDGATAARAQFQIGECLYAMARHEEAIRELLKVDILYAYPEWSAAALYEAGRCFEELQQPREARDQFMQVRDRFGETRWASMAAQRLDSLAGASLPGQSR